MSLEHAVFKLKWSAESMESMDGSNGWSAMLTPSECQELLDFVEKARELIWQLKTYVESSVEDDSFQFSSLSEFLSALDADEQSGRT